MLDHVTDFRGSPIEFHRLAVLVGDLFFGSHAWLGKSADFGQHLRIRDVTVPLEECSEKGFVEFVEALGVVLTDP